MHTYLQLLKHVLNSGQEREDRTGIGTLSIFGYQVRFNLQDGFPLLTTKKLHFKSIAHELLWFLKGDTNIRYLHDNGVRIWDEWANKDGDLGPIYGHQWRSWPTNRDDKSIDQITSVIEAIKHTPNSRRLVVSSWNVADLPHMALFPCHILFQFYVHKGYLSCSLYQRSADIFLGLPFNIASYALLTHMIAYVSDLKVGELVISLGDAHLYKNHIIQAKEQMKRDPLKLCNLEINSDNKDIFNIKYEDIRISGYKAHPHIPATVAV